MSETCANPECKNDRDKHDSVMGSYCSYACYYRHQGSKLLRDIEYNHTYCASCGSKLKEIEKPKEYHPDVYIGYQHRTPNAAMGEKSVISDGVVIDTTGTICDNCGSTSQSDTYMREFHYSDFIKRVIKFLRTKYKQGGMENPVNERVFLDTLKAGFSMEYSLGKATE